MRYKYLIGILAMALSLATGSAQTAGSGVTVIEESGLSGEQGSKTPFNVTLPESGHTYQLFGSVTSGYVSLNMAPADEVDSPTRYHTTITNGGFIYLPNVPSGAYTMILVGNSRFSGCSFKLVDLGAIPLPDLTATTLKIKTTIDKASLRLVAVCMVGTPFVVKSTIENKGNADANNIRVHLFASIVDDIDPKIDLDLGILTVIDNLPAGGSYKIHANAVLPLNLPHQYSGDITLGIAIDPEGSILESDRTNNWNVGFDAGAAPLHGDKEKVAVYDPQEDGTFMVDPHGTPLSFASKAEGGDYLRQLGFDEPYTGAEKYLDAGWSLGINSDYFSYRRGVFMPPLAFRYQAWFKLVGGRWQVLIQGPEPNPRHFVDADWYLYTADYHIRF